MQQQLSSWIDYLWVKELNRKFDYLVESGTSSIQSGRRSRSDKGQHQVLRTVNVDFENVGEGAWLQHFSFPRPLLLILA